MKKLITLLLIGILNLTFGKEITLNSKQICCLNASHLDQAYDTLQLKVNTITNECIIKADNNEYRFIRKSIVNNIIPENGIYEQIWYDEFKHQRVIVKLSEDGEVLNYCFILKGMSLMVNF